MGIVYELTRVDRVFIRTFAADHASVATVMHDGDSLNLH